MPIDKDLKEQIWLCMNLDCLAYNTIEDSDCFGCDKKIGWLSPEVERIVMDAQNQLLQSLIEELPEKKKPTKCTAGYLCDGDMCCDGIPYINREYNQALDTITTIIKERMK